MRKDSTLEAAAGSKYDESQWPALPTLSLSHEYYEYSSISWVDKNVISCKSSKRCDYVNTILVEKSRSLDPWFTLICHPMSGRAKGFLFEHINNTSSSRAQPPSSVDPAKFAQRAIGRSPEEHAALERVLAERRRRRGDGSSSNSRARSRSPVAGPGQGRADLAQQRRNLERRERELERQREDLRIWQIEQEHDLKQRRLQQERELAAQERRIADQVQAQQSASGPSADFESQALQSLPVAQRRAALLAPFGVTGVRRRAKGKSKGAGWHKRGYRDANGDMWINVKIGEENTQGQDVWEGETLVGLVEQVQSKYRRSWILSATVQSLLTWRHIEGCQEGSDYGCQARRGTLDWDLLFRKKSLRQLLTSLEEAGLKDSDVLVRDLFDGGETVYYRLYNGDGNYVKHVW